MISTIVLYSHLSFCSKLNFARRIESPRKVEEVLWEHYYEVKPQDPWFFFRIELKKCGIEMEPKPNSNLTSKI